MYRSGDEMGSGQHFPAFAPLRELTREAPSGACKHACQHVAGDASKRAACVCYGEHKACRGGGHLRHLQLGMREAGRSVDEGLQASPSPKEDQACTCATLSSRKNAGRLS